MSALFLGSRQLLMQGAVIGIELAILMVATGRHADLWPAMEVEQTG